MSYPDVLSRVPAELPPLVVTYHYVRPANSDGVTGLTPEAFEAQLIRIGRTRRFVTAEEFAESVDRTGSGEPGTALITFDDAVLDQYTHAFPVLRSLGVPAVFFAPMRPFDSSLPDEQRWTSQHLLHALAETLGWEELERRVQPHLKMLGFGVPGGPTLDQREIDRLYHYEEPRKRRLKYAMAFAISVDDAFDILTSINRTPSSTGAAPRLCASGWFMNPEHLRELQEAGHSIGGHGFDHAAMGVMSPEQQAADLRRAQELMDRLTGRAWRTMAYPFGSATPRTEKIARTLGYSLCFTTRDRVDCKFVDDQLEREESGGVALDFKSSTGSLLRRTA
jgi:peptidoglycan/xylan/chitin deacetylase (PgdA/CDA1 family)